MTPERLILKLEPTSPSVKFIFIALKSQLCHWWSVSMFMPCGLRDAKSVNETVRISFQTQAVEPLSRFGKLFVWWKAEQMVSERVKDHFNAMRAYIIQT